MPNLSRRSIISCSNFPSDDFDKARSSFGFPKFRNLLGYPLDLVSGSGSSGTRFGTPNGSALVAEPREPETLLGDLLQKIISAVNPPVMIFLRGRNATRVIVD